MDTSEEIASARTVPAVGGAGGGIARGEHSARNVHPDLRALAALVLLVGAAAWPLVGFGTHLGSDTAPLLFPMYAHLGERLRALEIPAWNPHIFSGTPFAADPQSGWMSWPVMLVWTLLPLEAAARSYGVVLLLIAALGAYALARALGLGAAPALLAGVAHALAGFTYVRVTSYIAYPSVVAWLPWMLACAELGVRARGRLVRALWWGGAGLALSQIAAVWIGQGTYYALLLLGAYLAYRTLLAPPPRLVRFRDRLAALVASGAAVGAWAVGLGAAGLLPRVEYNLLSTLAGGYAGSEQAFWGGWGLGDWALPLWFGRWYAGATVALLALAALPLARRRYAAPFWAVAVIGVLILSAQGPSLLHLPLWLLPGFRSLHAHEPERIVMLLYPCVAMLAAIALQCVLERWGARREPGARWRRGAGGGAFSRDGAGENPPAIATPAGGPGGYAPTPSRGGPACPPRRDGARGRLRWMSPRRCGSVASSLRPVGMGVRWSTLRISRPCGVAVRATRLVARVGWRRLNPTLLAALVVLAVWADLVWAGQRTLARERTLPAQYGVRVVDLDRYYAPSGAARFLRARRERGGAARFFGYDPATFWDHNRDVPYRYRYYDPRLPPLLVNNSALLHGLEDIQGHNPLQLRRYRELIERLNGGPQEYRSVYVLSGGIASPLLDLLAARYVVVPAVIAPERADLARLVRAHDAVYADRAVRVLERASALPRAWLVHEARQLPRGRALDLLARGEIDPRRVALLEVPPPPLAPPRAPSADRVRVEDRAPERLRVATESAAPGLLVLSETHYPAWRAYVDGAPAELYVADHALRAVAVPAGRHTVEVRYESWTLRLGLGLSLAAHALLLGLAVVIVWRARARTR